MKFSTDISEELNSISPLLAGIEKKNIFSVPEGYFDTLTVNLLKKINSNSVNSTLAVPRGYFENLSSQVLNKIKLLQDDPAEELRSLSPMLYSVQNENVFAVPRGYFKNLQDDILNKVLGSQTKVVAIKKRDTVWRYAVAAVMTGVIAVSSLLIFNKSQQLSVNQTNEAYIQTASQYKNEQQISEGIAKLSDNDIIKYLETTSTDIDNEVLNTTVEEKGLPAQKDYLLNEKTLDIYLDKLNAKDSQN